MARNQVLLPQLDRTELNMEERWVSIHQHSSKYSVGRHCRRQGFWMTTGNNPEGHYLATLRFITQSPCRLTTSVKRPGERIAGQAMSVVSGKSFESLAKPCCSRSGPPVCSQRDCGATKRSAIVKVGIDSSKHTSVLGVTCHSQSGNPAQVITASSWTFHV